MRIEHEAVGTTILAGDLPDQAALHGLLLKIQRLGLPLLDINSSEIPAATTDGVARADRDHLEQDVLDQEGK